MKSKKNYQKELDLLLESKNFKNEPASLLLHSCCAPCSSYVLEYLSEYFNITVFFYNPNLYPDFEYEKRLKEQIRFIQNYPFMNPVSIIEIGFDKKEFNTAVKGLEQEREGGMRCESCFKLRLSKTAELAKELNADYFTTTLSISPHKNAALINEIGQSFAKEQGVLFLPSDFKKNGGFKRSTVLSKEHNLYRQSYCGCVYSYEESLKRNP